MHVFRVAGAEHEKGDADSRAKQGRGKDDMKSFDKKIESHATYFFKRELTRTSVFSAPTISSLPDRDRTQMP